MENLKKLETMLEEIDKNSFDIISESLKKERIRRKILTQIITEQDQAIDFLKETIKSLEEYIKEIEMSNKEEF